MENNNTNSPTVVTSIPTSPINTSQNTVNTTNNSNTSTNYSTILDTWKVFNIEKKKQDLGDSVTQIGNSKDECLKSRKVLAKQTQDFKKITDDEKIKQLHALLKLYQDEVDKLTKRSKFSEGCFLGLYKDISEMSDPVPCLVAALEEASKPDHSARLEMENKKLREELTEFKKEFQEIQNQEVTIRRLEDKLKESESKQEHLTIERLNNRESEIRMELQEKLSSIIVDRDELSRHNTALQEEIAKLSKINYEAQSQLMEMRTRVENESYQKQSEIDLLSNELDRVSNKLSTLEIENMGIREDTQKEVTSLDQYIKRISDLELELLSREGDISKYVDLNSDLRQQLKTEQSSIEDLHKSISVEKEKSAKLERYIKENPSPLDYENMKKELQALQQVIGSEEIQNPNSDTKLLKDKNRQLESDSTKLRLLLHELELELQSKSEKIIELDNTIIKQNHLISNIEQDLNLLNLNQQHHQSSLSQQADQLLVPIVNNNDSNNLVIANKQQDFDQSTVSLNLSQSQLNISSITSNNNNTSNTENDKTFEIVVGQRDRFKAKVDQLEVEKSQLSKKIESLSLEIHSLKNDNIKLYEKIRFLQSYDKSKPNNNNNNNSNNNANNNGSKRYNTYDVEKANNMNSGNNSGNPEEKYGKLYEESINPFLSFNKKEKYRRYKEMNTAERVILNTSRFFLSNKYSRLFLFIYSILLHLLVFLTLYKLAVTTTEQHQYNDFAPNTNMHQEIQENQSNNNN